jgi:hypothetical protein
MSWNSASLFSKRTKKDENGNVIPGESSSANGEVSLDVDRQKAAQTTKTAILNGSVEINEGEKSY